MALFIAFLLFLFTTLLTSVNTAALNITALSSIRPSTLLPNTTTSFLATWTPPGITVIYFDRITGIPTQTAATLFPHTVIDIPSAPTHTTLSTVTVTQHITSTLTVSLVPKTTLTMQPAPKDHVGKYPVYHIIAPPAATTATQVLEKRVQGSGEDVPAAMIDPASMAVTVTSTSDGATSTSVDTASSTTTAKSSRSIVVFGPEIPDPTKAASGAEKVGKSVWVSGLLAMGLGLVIGV